MYTVYDSVGAIVRVFPTYEEAIVFKYTRGNFGWYIMG